MGRQSQTKPLQPNYLTQGILTLEDTLIESPTTSLQNNVERSWKN